MKKPIKLKSTLVAVALCMASAGWTTALAQDVYSAPNQSKTPQQSRTQNAPATPQTITKCSQLIGTKVENQQGQCLGKIKDVVVSFNNNQVSYCVLSVNHGPFAKSKCVAVPLAAFQTSADGAYLVLNASKENLAKASGFDRNGWPSEIIPAWGAEPGPAVELPPSIVYGTTPTFVAPRAHSWAADPTSRAPYGEETASRAIDGLQDQVWFGAALMTH